MPCVDMWTLHKKSMSKLSFANAYIKNPLFYIKNRPRYSKAIRKSHSLRQARPSQSVCWLATYSRKLLPYEINLFYHSMINNVNKTKNFYNSSAMQKYMCKLHEGACSQRASCTYTFIYLTPYMNILLWKSWQTAAFCASLLAKKCRHLAG